MDEQTTRLNIATFFPDLKIEEIKKLGEGTGNVAYEVNIELIFRFPKKQENQRQLEKEISFQKILKQYSTLPYPDFTCIPHDHSFVGYKKLLGDPLLYKRSEFTEWIGFSQQIGTFLSKLHAIPNEQLNDLSLSKEQRSGDNWKELGKKYFEKTKHVIPERFFSSINHFFSSPAPLSTAHLVFCHNDLGIEHILVIGSKVIGIIDWGGVSLADPACDFARIYRDLGELRLDEVLAEYTDSVGLKNEIKQRAIFYGKCLLFEDLFYAAGQEIYLSKCFAALEWMFGSRSFTMLK